jgi:TPR repeat protein
MRRLAWISFDRGEIQVAESLMLRAVSLGDSASMYALGLMNDDLGKTTEALAWYEKAGHAGEVDGMNNAGSIYMRQKNLDKALEWWVKGANLGSSLCLRNYGVNLAERGEIEQAKSILEQAVSQGNTAAMRLLANLHRNSGDLERSIHWMTRAAKAGDTLAMLRMGHHCLSNGNEDEAEKWFLELSQFAETEPQESGQAMFELATLAVKRSDASEATQWLNRSAELGNFDAVGALLRLGPQESLSSA